jgi:glycosyltransferase involved in cell wall biosynthesis
LKIKNNSNVNCESLKIKNKKKIINYLLILFFIVCLNLCFNRTTINIYSKYKNEIDFIRSCINNTTIEKYERCSDPKLSIVIPVYNSIKYLNRLLRSIQLQKLKEIEIIFIEDCSTDKGFQLLKEYSKIDQRIVLIKNEENKGCLYSYVKGILETKGKFTMIIDNDDMLLPNLKELYEISEQNNKDINDFSYIHGKLNDLYENRMGSKELYQPNIKEIFFKKNYHGCTYINNKIMKSQIIKEAVKTLNYEYLNSNISLHCDTIIFICLFNYVQSYKSYNNFFIQIHINNANSSTSDISNKYNELIRVTTYLVQYISELKCSSSYIYNKHIKFGLEILNWHIDKINLGFKIDKLLEVLNNILKNENLNNKNKSRIYEIISLIKRQTQNKIR